MKWFVFAILAILAAAILIVILIGAAQPPAIQAELTELQSVPADAGFARAVQPRAFRFPQDHGPHPEYQTEWWYYTGNLDTAEGRHLGYQLTFFRRAITASGSARSSDWATNQIYFAHLAVTDVKQNTHFATERFSRGAAGLAGATGEPYHVWLENWQVTSLSADGSQVELSAEDSGYALSLRLATDKPPVLHGNGGLSPKSGEAGDASYYYSFTRLMTEGTIRLKGEMLAVKGLSWMDHEFGTTALGPDAIGWDWLSIQLSDRREIMFFQIRNKDGSIEPVSGGTVIEADGTTHHLSRDQVMLSVSEKWSSPSGGTYPARWSLAIPSERIDLTVRPYIADQEMRVSIVYWEGAVSLDGVSHGATVHGSGYVELTGYAPNASIPR